MKLKSPGHGQFGPKGHNLNNIGRQTLDDVTPNMKALGLIVTDKTIFKGNPYISLCKTDDPGARSVLTPGA